LTLGVLESKMSLGQGISKTKCLALCGGKIPMNKVAYKYIFTKILLVLHH
jgi:hypothetical protein